MSEFSLAFAVWSALAAAVGVIMALARTSPTEARSNLSKWIEWAGIHQIPTWFQPRSADQIVFRWATIAMAFLLALGIGFGLGAWWRPFAPAQELASWNIAPGPQGGPIGPILGVEFTQMFNTVPKPCTVRLTAPANSELAKTFVWLLTHGGPKADVICNIDLGTQPPDIDELTPTPTATPGIVIHWDDSFEIGSRIAHWFDASGFNVQVSHRLPSRAAPTLVWIDIGPGSPWK